MSESALSKRILTLEKPWSWKRFFFQWEWLLVIIFLLVNVMNSLLSPWYLSANTFLSAPMNFLDKAFIVLPMMLVIILGNIDISVGSIVALTSVLMAVIYNAGIPMQAALVFALVIGTALGGVNSLLLIKFRELPAMIVTLSTMTIYRGAAYVILENRASGGFPAWFSFLAWGYVGPVPFIFIVFAAAAIIFGLLLHRTSFGRAVYGMGSNLLACRYSGIRTDRVLLIVGLLVGFMSAVCSIFLTSRMGSTRPNVAMNYELDVIAMVVLGGVSTSGGTGRIAGPLLAIFIIGFLNYGLGLINVSAQLILIILGLLLVLSVLIMNLPRRPLRRHG
ncbi:MAG: ABC transporter permease [Spirochaetaceae bacterium]|jgi:rhamnose transport system permease protein|nr:ABC transporter permease [Spirochaetaceae bacterium]